jgi:DNA polymerase III epsilon subunit-like protein
MARRTGLIARLLEHLGAPGVDLRLDHRRAARPLRNARFVALDLETTGLDHRRDSIVQVAMVGIDMLRIADPPILHTFVDPRRPIPQAATRVHGIADDDVRGAPVIDVLLPRIAGAWHDAVVVGHHVRFDLAMLTAAARRGGHALARPPFLDTWALAAALDARLAHLDLADIARHFGIEVAGVVRHEALTDAHLAAQLFVRLGERMIATGHTTIGQAAALAERCRVPR